MDTSKNPGDAPGPAGPESRRGKRPSAAAKAARAEAAAARQSQLDRKRRTRELIQLGGVAAAFGFSDPGQLETILAALTRSRKGSARLRELGVKETERWPS